MGGTEYREELSLGQQHTTTTLLYLNIRPTTLVGRYGTGMRLEHILRPQNRADMWMRIPVPQRTP